MTLEPPNRYLRRSTVSLSDLFLNNDVISGYTFEECRLIGPGVIVAVGSTTFSQCKWEGDLTSLLWPIADDRETVIGAVAFEDCELIGCGLSRIGLAVPVAMLEDVRRGFAG